MIKQLIAAIMAIACLCGARIGHTASDDNFYKGKTIRLIVAFSAGGGYDAYSRTIGRHLGKHIPGNPAIVVENMTGAGGIIHANFMYQAKPDGLIIGNNAGGLILQQIMGAKGTADIRLAAESGELAGACFAWESFKTTWRKGLESGDFNVILQAMPKKHPELPNVPLANDYVKTEEGRRLLKYGIYDTAIITRPYFVAPGTPKSRVQLLRRAFADTLKDPEFLAEAKKASLDIQHVSGEEIEGVVQGLFKIEPAFIARMKQVLVP